jgi:small subunit ribosomal protein S17
METKVRQKKTMVGVVTSNAMEKTVVVRVDRLVKHDRYRKYVKRYASFKAHDEANACGIGDRVLIVECRPLSKDKRWRVRQVLEKSEL